MPCLLLALDTSPASFLDRLGYMERLRQIADILLASAVVAELQAAPGSPGSGVPDLPGIEVRPPEAEQRDEVGRELEAHAGKVETIALALGGAIVPVIDERRAYRYAAARGLTVLGTLALLVELHRRGMAARPIEDDLAFLAAAGMYITKNLIAATIEEAQQGPPGPGEDVRRP